MKLGMIFECGPDGADKKVCEYLAKKLIPKIGIRSETLDVKPNLIAECGRTAAMLLQEGCNLVFIIWDLHPAWRKDGEKPCRKEDREAIMAALTEAGVPHGKVCLVCIHEELEAWLLADGRAISAFLSTAAHPVKITDEKAPDSVQNPKKRMNRHFTQSKGQPYNDIVHAEKIIKLLPDLKKIRRSESYKRFEDKLSAFEPTR